MTKLEQEASDYADTVKVDPDLAPVYVQMVRSAVILGYVKGSMDAIENYPEKINAV